MRILGFFLEFFFPCNFHPFSLQIPFLANSAPPHWCLFLFHAKAVFTRQLICIAKSCFRCFCHKWFSFWFALQLWRFFQFYLIFVFLVHVFAKIRVNFRFRFGRSSHWNITAMAVRRSETLKSRRQSYSATVTHCTIRICMVTSELRSCFNAVSIRALAMK